jgi:hypothetical protein
MGSAPSALSKATSKREEKNERADLVEGCKGNAVSFSAILEKNTIILRIEVSQLGCMRRKEEEI